MHKQTLKNLRDILINTTLKQFHEGIFPDFRQPESNGYLEQKYLLFQNNFGLFLSELDEEHLSNMATAIPTELPACEFGSPQPKKYDDENNLFTILENAANASGVISGSITGRYVPADTKCGVIIGLVPGSNEGGYLHVIAELFGSGEMFHVMTFRHGLEFAEPELLPIVKALRSAFVGYLSD